jgi:hypothetical protein
MGLALVQLEERALGQKCFLYQPIPNTGRQLLPPRITINLQVLKSPGFGQGYGLRPSGAIELQPGSRIDMVDISRFPHRA